MIDLIEVGKRLLVFLGVIVYMVFLHWTYIDIISPAFSYMGYIYNDPSLILLLIVWAMALLPASFMPINSERPSQLVYWILYALVFIPAMIIPLYSIQISINYLLTFNTVLLISFSFLGLIYKFPLLAIPRITISPFLFWFGLFLISLFFYGIILWLFGFQFQWVSFLDVYRVRAEYGTTLNDGGVYAFYIVDWLSYVINPFLIVFGLMRKKFTLLLIGVLGQVMIYSISGNRTVILSIFYIIVLLYVFRKGGRHLGIFFAWGLAGVVILSCMADLITGTSWATSLFVRRLIITPGLLTGYYLDFFSEHPKTYLAHSIFEGIFHYPYPLMPPKLIGYTYLSNPETSANANVWADAYANFGLWGMLVFTVLLGLLLWLFDCLSTDRNQFLTMMVLALPALTLVDGALLTAVGNHGLGFAFLLIYFLPDMQDDCERDRGEGQGREHLMSNEQSGAS